MVDAYIESCPCRYIHIFKGLGVMHMCIWETIVNTAIHTHDGKCDNVIYRAYIHITLTHVEMKIYFSWRERDFHFILNNDKVKVNLLNPLLVRHYIRFRTWVYDSFSSVLFALARAEGATLYVPVGVALVRLRFKRSLRA